MITNSRNEKQHSDLQIFRCSTISCLVVRSVMLFAFFWMSIKAASSHLPSDYLLKIPLNWVLAGKGKRYFHYKIIRYVSKLVTYCEICQYSTKTCCMNTPKFASIRDEYMAILFRKIFVYFKQVVNMKKNLLPYFNFQ